MTEAIFWLALGGVAYVFAGYPVLVALLARLRPRPVRRANVRPTVTLLITAYNEARTIATKLDNCLALRYPAGRLDIVVASDGSTDGTDDVVRSYAARGVRLLAFDRRRGKPSLLNDAVPRCRGEIVVLSDARQRYDVDAIEALVENFADPAVGAASGELHLLNPTGVAVGAGVGAYWRYEKFIRKSESALDSCVGATGAIYAIRRALFAPIPADTLLDDVLIPMRIVRLGYRVVFEPDARAWDGVAAAPRQEYTRKVRTLVGNLQLFARERWMLGPGNRLWLQTLSHKLLRIAAPFFLLGAFGANVVLAADSTFYRAVLAAQVLF